MPLNTCCMARVTRQVELVFDNCIKTAADNSNDSTENENANERHAGLAEQAADDANHAHHISSRKVNTVRCKQESIPDTNDAVCGDLTCQADHVAAGQECISCNRQ